MWPRTSFPAVTPWLLATSNTSRLLHHFCGPLKFFPFLAAATLPLGVLHHFCMPLQSCPAVTFWARPTVRWVCGPIGPRLHPTLWHQGAHKRRQYGGFKDDALFGWMHSAVAIPPYKDGPSPWSSCTQQDGPSRPLGPATLHSRQSDLRVLGGRGAERAAEGSRWRARRRGAFAPVSSPLFTRLGQRSGQTLGRTRLRSRPVGGPGSTARWRSFTPPSRNAASLGLSAGIRSCLFGALGWNQVLGFRV